MSTRANPAHALDGGTPSLSNAGHHWPAASDEHRWAYNKHTQMKIAYIIGCTLLLFVLGCKHETRSAQSAPAGSKTISDGGYTWTLGAATMNGTNVPLSNITVRAITNQAPK